MYKRIVTASLLILAGSSALAQGRQVIGEMFGHADANDDGMVTREEFGASRAERFARLDRNSDGFLDDADSRQRAARREGGERFAEIRKTFDSNGDGKISKDEFVTGPSPLFDQADSDHSGVLDAQELAAARAAAKARMSER